MRKKWYFLGSRSKATHDKNDVGAGLSRRAGRVRLRLVRAGLARRAIIKLGDEDVPCMVRNLSAVGATLILKAEVRLPDLVTFFVPSLAREYCGPIQWRLQNTAKLHFGAELLHRSPFSFALVVAAPGHERYAAATLIKEYGFLVHTADAVSEAITVLTTMGTDHPLVRRGRPLLFATSDSMQDDLNWLVRARGLSPEMLILIACDDCCAIAGLLDAVVPREFQARQIREHLQLIFPGES